MQRQQLENTATQLRERKIFIAATLNIKFAIREMIVKEQDESIVWKKNFDQFKKHIVEYAIANLEQLLVREKTKPILMQSFEKTNIDPSMVNKEVMSIAFDAILNTFDFKNEKTTFAYKDKLKKITEDKSNLWNENKHKMIDECIKLHNEKLKTTINTVSNASSEQISAPEPDEKDQSSKSTKSVSLPKHSKRKHSEETNEAFIQVTKKAKKGEKKRKRTEDSSTQGPAKFTKQRSTQTFATTTTSTHSQSTQTSTDTITSLLTRANMSQPPSVNAVTEMKKIDLTQSTNSQISASGCTNKVEYKLIENDINGQTFEVRLHHSLANSFKEWVANQNNRATKDMQNEQPLPFVQDRSIAARITPAAQARSLQSNLFDQRSLDTTTVPDLNPLALSETQPKPVALQRSTEQSSLDRSFNQNNVANPPPPRFNTSFVGQTTINFFNLGSTPQGPRLIPTQTDLTNPNRPDDYDGKVAQLASMLNSNGYKAEPILRRDGHGIMITFYCAEKLNANMQHVKLKTAYKQLKSNIHRIYPDCVLSVSEKLDEKIGTDPNHAYSYYLHFNIPAVNGNEKIKDILQNLINQISLGQAPTIYHPPQGGSQSRRF